MTQTTAEPKLQDVALEVDPTNALPVSGPTPTAEDCEPVDSPNGSTVPTEPADTQAEFLGDLNEKVGAIADEIQRLRVDDAVLSDIHQQYRALREQFHERDVLSPIFRGLIGLTDRCRREKARHRQVLESLADQARLESVLAVRQLVEARDADVVEIEALLGQFGVERFSNPGASFDASVQRCVTSVPTSKPQAHQRIAKRLLPGYRRHGRIIRPEYVNVYVYNDSHPDRS